MKPVPFNLLRPKSVDEALALLQAHGDEAKVLAGGQSLVPLMNFRLAQPHNLIDLNGVEDLDQIKFDDQTLSLSAMVRQRDVERSSSIAGRFVDCDRFSTAACRFRLVLHRDRAPAWRFCHRRGGGAARLRARSQDRLRPCRAWWSRSGAAPRGRGGTGALG